MLPHGHRATSRDGESYTYSRKSVAVYIPVPSAAVHKGNIILCYGVVVLRKEQNKSVYPCLEITCTDGLLNVIRMTASIRAGTGTLKSLVPRI
jgi:hypothetical protein